MNNRDKRALKLLGLWLVCLGGYFFAERIISMRKEWAVRKTRLIQARKNRLALEQELGRLAEIRTQELRSFPSEWQTFTEDQFRLKGQDAVLASAQKAGLASVRLRPETVDPTLAGRQLIWTLEGEGFLAQWLEALETIERSQPFMAIQSYRLNLPGDPWRPEAVDSKGPVMKGSLTCCWVIKP